MTEVVDAFDRAPLAQLEGDDAADLDDKIEAAQRGLKSGSTHAAG
jgi:hypothetical protein